MVFLGSGQLAGFQRRTPSYFVSISVQIDDKTSGTTNVTDLSRRQTPHPPTAARQAPPFKNNPAGTSIPALSAAK